MVSSRKVMIGRTTFAEKLSLSCGYITVLCWSFGKERQNIASCFCDDFPHERLNVSANKVLSIISFRDYTNNYISISSEVKIVVVNFLNLAIWRKEIQFSTFFCWWKDWKYHKYCLWQWTISNIYLYSDDGNVVMGCARTEYQWVCQLWFWF